MLKPGFQAEVLYMMPTSWFASCVERGLSWLSSSLHWLSKSLWRTFKNARVNRANLPRERPTCSLKAILLILLIRCQSTLPLSQRRYSFPQLCHTLSRWPLSGQLSTTGLANMLFSGTAKCLLCSQNCALRFSQTWCPGSLSCGEFRSFTFPLDSSLWPNLTWLNLKMNLKTSSKRNRRMVRWSIMTT